MYQYLDKKVWKNGLLNIVHKKHMELLDVSGAAGEAGLRGAEEKRI